MAAEPHWQRAGRQATPNSKKRPVRYCTVLYVLYIPYCTAQHLSCLLNKGSSLRSANANLITAPPKPYGHSAQVGHKFNPHGAKSLDLLQTRLFQCYATNTTIIKLHGEGTRILTE